MRGRPPVHRAHLELNLRRCLTARRGARGALLLGCALALVSIPRTTTSAFLWSGGAPFVPGTFVGATFSPATAPVVTQRFKGVNDQLGWTAVTFSGAATVSYVVMRTDPNGTTVQVCTGADAPVTSGQSVTCMDRKAPKSSQYSEQPVITNAGSVTWSLAPSIPA